MVWWHRIFRTIIPPAKNSNLRELEKKIGYRFRQPELGERAIRHRSLLRQNNLSSTDAYERLEFLGDAVLGLVAARYLIQSQPEAGEGELTKMKSLIVSGEVLSQRAREIGFGRHLLMGTGEIRSGGRKRPSILEDTFESLVGAIYLDGGMKPATEFINRHLLSYMGKICDSDEHRNYKSMLLEHAQAELSTQPVYRVISEEGPDHDKTYRVEVSISEKALGVGEGNSKKRAEQRAAKKALDKLGVDYDSF